VRRTAPKTFANKTDAGRWLTTTEADLIAGRWTDPLRGKMLLGDFGECWITERSGLRPRTRDLYRWLFEKHLRQHLGSVRLAELDAAAVRKWRHKLIAAGVSATVTAKAYRLLRAIMNTAVDDGVVPRNPCQIKGAGSESAPERPTLTVAQVFQLADRMPARFRVIVLLTAFGSLRWGEVSALRRADVDSTSGVVRVRAAYTERSSGELILGPPKSAAGARAVTVPPPIAGELHRQLDAFVGSGEDALLFTGLSGQPMRRSNFNKVVKWTKTVADLGLPGLHFHDLRHTGNVLAAQTPGATLRDLMARMGHNSMRAALIYQHRTREADRHIAAAMEARIASDVGTQKEALRPDGHEAE
jgi:integrase